MKRHHIIILISIYWTLVAFPTSHPITTTGGYTGAPLDSFCTTCHQDQNQNISGDATLNGVPPYVFKNETYPLSINVNIKKNAAYRAGFQLLALESDLSNAGILINNSDFSVLKVAGGKRYLGHNPALEFKNDTLVQWAESWKIEDNDEGTLTLYLAAMLGSGDEGNGNDRAIFKSFSTEVRDSFDAIWATSDILSTENCSEATRVSVKINDYGGISPIKYAWNTNDTTQIISNLLPGKYYFTVTDAVQNKFQDSVLVMPIEPGRINGVNIIENVNQTFTINILSENITDDYSYYLINNETNILDSSELAVFNNIPKGNYNLFAQNNSGCSTDTLEIILDINTSILENDQTAREIKIYPNPATNFLYLDNKLITDELLITDTKGQILKVRLNSNNQIDITRLPAGIYILTIISNSKKTSKLFVKNQT